MLSVSQREIDTAIRFTKTEGQKVAICSNNHEFCVTNDGVFVQNDEFCVTNDGLCIQNHEFNANVQLRKDLSDIDESLQKVFKNDEFPFKMRNSVLHITIFKFKHYEFCVNNDEFFIQNVDFCINSRNKTQASVS